MIATTSFMVRPSFSQVLQVFAYRGGIHARPNLASFWANGTKKLLVEGENIPTL
jgi:hypothetical protein